MIGYTAVTADRQATLPGSWRERGACRRHCSPPISLHAAGSSFLSTRQLPTGRRSPAGGRVPAWSAIRRRAPAVYAGTQLYSYRLVPGRYNAAGWQVPAVLWRYISLPGRETSSRSGLDQAIERKLHSHHLYWLVALHFVLDAFVCLKIDLSHFAKWQSIAS